MNVDADTVQEIIAENTGVAQNQNEYNILADDALKDYVHFKGALIDFRAYYGLEEYNLKQLDKYLWLLGKDYFPKHYRKKV